MPGPEYITALMAGETSSEAPPTDAPWNEIAQLLLDTPISDRPGVFEQWVSQAGDAGIYVISALVELQTQSRTSDENEVSPLGRLWRLDQFLSEDLGALPVLIGEDNNAIVVRGEGGFLIGPRGAGKTLCYMDFTLKGAAERSILGFATHSPLSFLILQAELPAPFLQNRFNRMIEGNENPESFNIRERIHIQEIIGKLDLCQSRNLALLSRLVGELRADLVILDPFLSFFSGDENSNSGVRIFLDTIKFEIAQANNCAVLFTDHVSKYDLGKESGARGAGAKGDWASFIIHLLPHPNPSDPDNRFISAEIVKLRYGLEPSEPIILRRDSHSFLHTVWLAGNDQNIETLLQLVAAEGGEVGSQRRLLEIIQNHFNIGGRRAELMLRTALGQGVLQRIQGRNNAYSYRLVSDPPGDDGISSEGNNEDGQ